MSTVVFYFRLTDLNNNAKNWELPLWDDSSYSNLKSGCEVMRGHPQDVLENNVDFSHLGALHGFEFLPTNVQISETSPTFNIVERLNAAVICLHVREFE